MTLEEMIASDPRLAAIYSRTGQSNVVYKTDAQGRGYWDIDPTKRPSGEIAAENVQSAYEGLNDPNPIRARLYGDMIDRGLTPFGASAATLLADFLPVVGGVNGGIDAYNDGTEAVGAFQRGEYKDAAISGASSLVNGGIGLVSSLPLVGGLMRNGKRAIGSVPEVVADLSRGGGYQVRDALRAASDANVYTPPAGRPGLLSLPGFDTKFEARPVSPVEEAAMDYMRRRGVMDYAPLTSYPPFSEDRARAVALAYADMAHDPTNPAVKRAYDAVIDETLAQYNALKDTGIDFKFLRDGMSDPYAASPGLGYKDMVENGRLWVFPTDFGFGTSSAFDPSENPLLTRVGRIGDKPDAVANDAFRVVHDAFGHYGPGNPFFRHQGEERAWLEHSRMFSPEARGAMTSETRGQNSWLNFGPHGEANRKALGADTVFADQKTGLMPQWTWGLLTPDDEKAAIEEFLRSRGVR